VQRITVIGCGGSGKSHLSRGLGALLGATVTHLDAVYYDDEWNTLSPEKFASAQEELVAAPSWVIDGNYASTLPIRLRACDTVVFLDIPAVMCLWGIAQRRARHRGGQHAGGVYDRITWSFIRYIWHYRRDMRPRVQALIADHAGHARVVNLRSRRAARDWLAEQQRIYSAG
jgi:adenylate kinase family enzyme